MGSLAILGIGIVFALFFIMNPVFAQSIDASEQTTLSKDLQNNPVAQDILKKIEQTKQWIAELEQRNYENIKKNSELEQKREQALNRLNEDLADWEKLWEYYSPHNSFERFVEKIPDSQVQGVFWDQFEFQEQAAAAGKAAFKKIILNGGSLREAVQEYRTVSETKRIELIEVNSQSNVKHNLAYYNQQILFDKEGKFVDSAIAREQLRKYYTDYRTNPAYLLANPNDVKSWELGNANINTECREGQIIIHRFHIDDYVCITMSTAEMWIQHGMGEIIGAQNLFQPEQLVTPLTTCNDGFVVIFHKNTEKYSCILEGTANKWIGQGIAELHDSEEFIMNSIKKKESFLKIAEINKEIQNIKNELYNKKIELKKSYDKKYYESLEQYKTDEKNIIRYYYENTDIVKEELSKKILDVREKYEDEKDDILKDKVRSLEELEKEYDEKMVAFVQNYEFNLYVKIIFNSDKTQYEAVLK